MKVMMLLAMTLLMATTSFGAEPGNILGKWKTDGGDSQLEIYRCGKKICGKIVWLKVPKYIDRNDGPVGKTKVDRKNPSPVLRNRPILGLQVIKGLIPKGNSQWVNGTCYNPETGKSYKSTMKLVSPGKLELRGYIGISMIGHTLVLTR